MAVSVPRVASVSNFDAKLQANLALLREASANARASQDAGLRALTSFAQLRLASKRLGMEGEAIEEEKRQREEQREFLRQVQSTSAGFLRELQDERLAATPRTQAPVLPPGAAPFPEGQEATRAQPEPITTEDRQAAFEEAMKAVAFDPATEGKFVDDMFAVESTFQKLRAGEADIVRTEAESRLRGGQLLEILQDLFKSEGPISQKAANTFRVVAKNRFPDEGQQSEIEALAKQIEILPDEEATSQMLRMLESMERSGTTLEKMIQEAGTIGAERAISERKGEEGSSRLDEVVSRAQSVGRDISSTTFVGLLAEDPREAFFVAQKEFRKNPKTLELAGNDEELQNDILGAIGDRIRTIKRKRVQPFAVARRAREGDAQQSFSELILNDSDLDALLSIAEMMSIDITDVLRATGTEDILAPVLGPVQERGRILEPEEIQNGNR